MSSHRAQNPICASEHQFSYLIPRRVKCIDKFELQYLNNIDYCTRAKPVLSTSQVLANLHHASRALDVWYREADIVCATRERVGYTTVAAANVFNYFGDGREGFSSAGGIKGSTCSGVVHSSIYDLELSLREQAI